MKLTSRSLIASAALLASVASLAQTKAPEPDYTLAYNLGATTDYRYRGISQTRLKPTVQGGIDFSHKSGFYLGAWGSGIKWIKDGGGDASVELDLYGGYKATVGAIGYDLGVLTYQYPSNKLNPSANTTELYGAATMGPFTAKYSHTISKDYFGFAGAKAGSGLKGTNSGYLNLAFAQEVAPSITVKASVGFTRFASDIKDLGVPNYMDYSVGGAYDFGSGLSLGAAVVGANKKAFFGHVNKSRVIVTLTKTL